MYHCELCERWFCEKHLKPRLAFIRDLNAESIPEIRTLYETEVRDKEGKGHPDFQYSRKRLEELHLEEKIRFELINKALNGENFSRCQKCDSWASLYLEANYCPKCGFELAKTPTPVPKPSMKRFSWHRTEEPQATAKEEKTKKVIVSEGPYHFEKRKVRGTHHFRRMRPWYEFLLAFSLFDLALILIGEYYLSIAGEYTLGWQWMDEAIIPSAILLIIGALYLRRWWRKRMRRFWNG